MFNASSLVGRVSLNLHHNTEEEILKNANFMIPHKRRCNVECILCGALHWKEELSVTDYKKQEASFSMCCQKNKVTLPMADKSAQGYPLSLQGLFTQKDDCKPICFQHKTSG
jgi:hypothetical protein